MSFLKDDIFKIVLSSTPIFSIDIVYLTEELDVVCGLRKNEPAKGYWFLPGGRVYKNETLENAFSRITLSELGIKLSYEDSIQLGVYEHIWDNSIYGKEINTHYINCPFLIRGKKTNIKLDSADEQHLDFKWLDLTSFENDSSIHKLSKLFLPTLKEKLEH